MKAAGKVLVVTGAGSGMGREVVGGDATFMDRIYRLDPRRAAGFIAKQMKSLLPPA